MSREISLKGFGLQVHPSEGIFTLKMLHFGGRQIKPFIHPPSYRPCSCSEILHSFSGKSFSENFAFLFSAISYGDNDLCVCVCNVPVQLRKNETVYCMKMIK